jgi:hypothetical protein
MRIFLQRLIEFYDSKSPEFSPHASAITGVIGEDLAVELFKHYIDNVLKGKIIDIHLLCNQGTSRGKRLDRWIHAIYGDNNYYLQTEIKNWTSHSLGGKKFPVNELEESNFRKKRWQRIFDDQSLRFKDKDNNLGKVTIKMKLPEHWKEGFDIMPLLIVWESMHRDGSDDPYFETDLEGNFYKKVRVFSLSTYIRNMLKKNISSIDLDIDVVSRRLKILGDLVK